MDEKILNQAKEQFDKFKEQAKEYVGNNEKLKDLVSKGEEKLKTLKLDDSIKDVPVLISMIKSYVTGEYKEVGVPTLIALVAALLYLVTAKDIIPDNIPLLGLVDDAAIVFICLKATSGDVEKYKTWMTANKKSVQA